METVACSHCGEPVALRGPRPTRTDRRYCAKRACRSARGRYIREQEPPSTAACANCGEAVRVRGPEPDSGNRFCSQVACQEAKRKDRMPPAPRPRCSGCGDEVPAWGRPPADGKRYCARPECRARKIRAAEGEISMEVRPCFRCGKDLPLRRGRVTDSPHGRWCSDPKCQKDRAERLGLLEELLPLYEDPERDPARYASLVAKMVSLFWQTRRGQPAVPCGGCGREDGVRNYRHPNPDGTDMCYALGRFPVPGQDLELAHGISVSSA